MPLRYTEDPASLESVKDVPEQYIIFYSSRDDNGRMWCPDCRAVEDIVDKIFTGKTDSPSGLVVYVGQRSEWKTPSNPFRGVPWNVGSIPTIIRLRDNARLGDEVEIQEKLDAFTSH